MASGRLSGCWSTATRRCCGSPGFPWWSPFRPRAFSLLVGIPLGTGLGLSRFPGRRFLRLVNTGMGLPPVVVGLVVSIFLWRNGPLGIPASDVHAVAMVIAQFIIALPIVAGFTMAATQQLDPKLRLQITALGASRLQMVWLL